VTKANEVLGKVRNQEHLKLLQEGDTTLSGSTYFWSIGMENHTGSQTARFESICTLRLATGKAGSYKELRRAGGYRNIENFKKAIFF